MIFKWSKYLSFLSYFVAVNVGYRSMRHIILRKYKFQCTHNIVRLAMRRLNPVAVENRRRQRLKRRTYHCDGPNDVWHIDGYDKLKSYGFPISGCIDGFSRRLIWLRCSHTNNDPKVIASYFLTSVSQSGICPRKSRTDAGTENVVIATLHSVLTNNEKAHVYGTSPSNQRIESFWNCFRRLRVQSWISFFENLESNGDFNCSNIQQIECLRYCFMEVLQNDLNEFVQFWNTHRIRRSKGAVCPPGIPDSLYHNPPPGFVECGLTISTDSIVTQWAHLTDNQRKCHDAEFEAYLDYLCGHHNLTQPTNWQTAADLFTAIKSVVC